MITSIFTILKDEQEYLDEFIQYHLSLGIDKIYVYDDALSTSHKSICDKYKDRVFHDSILSLYPENIRDRIIETKKDGTAKRGYQIDFMYAVLTYLKSNTDIDWVSYLDIDEFITLQNKEDNIPSILSLFSEYDGLIMQWENYNAQGHIYKPKGNVVDIYKTVCQPYVGSTMSPRASSKIFFNLKKWNPVRIKCNNHIPFRGYFCKPDFSRDTRGMVYDKIYLRHYITKSFEEYCNKIYARGQFQGSKKINYFFEWNPDIKKDDSRVEEMLMVYALEYLNGTRQLSIKYNRPISMDELEHRK